MCAMFDQVLALLLSVVYPENARQRTNALAYFARMQLTKKDFVRSSADAWTKILSDTLTVREPTHPSLKGRMIGLG